MNCPFCLDENEKIKELIIFETRYSYCALSLTYITRGHSLVIPKNHIKSLVDLGEEEREDFCKAIFKARAMLKDKLNATEVILYSKDGPSKNKTVEHAHFHLIPNYENEPLPAVYPLDTSSGYERKKLDEQLIKELKIKLK